MNNKYQFILFFALCFGLFSCALSRKPLEISASTDQCYTSETGHIYDSLLAVQKSSYDTVGGGVLVSKRFSRRATAIAKDINVYPILCEYVRMESQADKDNIKFLLVRQELSQRIALANNDLTSSLAEIACEKARMMEAKSSLDGWINRSVARVTVASIVAGAAATIAASAVSLAEGENQTEQSIAIAGAVVGTYLGFKALVNKRKIHFMHPRNHLQDFWEEKAHSRIFSPIIWNFVSKTFTLKGESTNGKKEVIKKWASSNLLTKGDAKDARKEALLMGAGGAYSSDELGVRINMFEGIEAEIDLIKYDLKRLQQELILGK
ncbi:MAG: hypothetical protein EAZ08_12745 [Cytophagales bacterium]|nr:MAG: hypothetical protein EAZ08_12745 [Cytophagales bacterium]